MAKEKKKFSVLNSIHPETPQPRKILRAVDCLKNDGVVVYPTDTVYGMGCSIFSKKGMERIVQLKGRKEHQPFSFICSNLQEISTYATYNNDTFRTLRRVLPGAYTFILQASKKAPRAVMSKRNKVGVRIPDHAVPLALVESLGHPVITTSVNRTGEESLSDPDEIFHQFGHGVDMILDCGIILSEPSTIIEWTDEAPTVVREGKGCIDFLS